MKPLNEVRELNEQLSEESRQATLDILIAQQIYGLEKLIETNGSRVKSPMSYNTCVGLIDQLKHFAPAIFRDTELNFDLVSSQVAPLHGKP